MERQNAIDRPLSEIIETTISSSAETYAVNPAEETIVTLVEVLNDLGAPTSVRVLAAERALKEVLDDFIVASNAADLIEEGVLSIRTLDEPSVNSLLLTGERVVSVITAGDYSAGLGTDEESFVNGTTGYYEDIWETASEFSLRTPPLSRVRSTLEAELGEGTLADFDAMLDSLETARGNGAGLDEVTISLLVAAKNEQLLYDISKWGEDVGLASKATFSRTKTRLEDRGLLETEKVPIDVGRPRLRLLLRTEKLQAADSDELAAVAMEELH